MRKIALILAGVLFVGIAFLAWSQIRQGMGYRFNPNDPVDLHSLKQIVAEAEKVRASIEAKKSLTGSYPEKLELGYLEVPLFKGKDSASFPMSYSVEEDRAAYGLYVKLNWDPGLFFTSSAQTWEFDPGNGGDSTLIK